MSAAPADMRPMRGRATAGRHDCRRAAQGGEAAWWGEVEYTRACLRGGYPGSYDAPPSWAYHGAPGAAAGVDRN